MTQRQCPLQQLARHSLDECLDTTADPQSIQVLIVDDDAAFADRLASFLHDEYGMTAIVETSGERALDHLTAPPDESSTNETIEDEDSVHADTTKEKKSPHADTTPTANDQMGQESPVDADDAIDCVVSDYQMPGIDGLELLERVRKTRSSLPVILFAGQGGESVAGKALRRGVDDYLQKDTGTDQFRLLATRIQTAVTCSRQALTLRTFYHAVEYAGHSIYITDPDGTIQYVNPAFEAITGYSADEAIGRDPSLLKSGVHDEAFYQNLWETITNGDVWENEIVNERKNGDRYIVEQTIAPITTEQDGNGQGDIAYFVAINNEITELQRRTEELERQNERLEEFARTLSHDLRNPLNVARGRVDLAEQTGDEEEFERVKQALERMDTILEDALTLAQQGLTVQEPESVPLRDIVHRAWETVVTEDATLACEIPDDVRVTMDTSRVCELLENLFRNAIEHAGSTVTIHVGVLDDQPGFYVADNGPGIPEENRDTVFETGYTTNEDGTGFGLAIVREIAAAHNWGIHLTDSAEDGARFEFAVPTADWQESCSQVSHD